MPTPWFLRRQVNSWQYGCLHEGLQPLPHVLWINCNKSRITWIMRVDIYLITFIVIIAFACSHLCCWIKKTDLFTSMHSLVAKMTTVVYIPLQLQFSWCLAPCKFTASTSTGYTMLHLLVTLQYNILLLQLHKEMVCRNSCNNAPLTFFSADTAFGHPPKWKSHAVGHNFVLYTEYPLYFSVV